MKRKSLIVVLILILCLTIPVIGFLSMERAGGEKEFHAVILAVEGNMITAEVTYDSASFFSAKLPVKIIFDANDSGETGLKVGDIIQGNYLEGTIEGNYVCVVCVIVKSTKSESPADDTRDESQENGQSNIDNEQNASVNALSQEELLFFENLFVSEYGRVFTTMLLSSEYDAPENIHLGWLFREGVPSEDGGWGYDISEEEMSALQDVMDEESYALFLTADSYKIPRAVMDELLMTWLGISLEDTKQIGMEFFTYLEEYDAYYSAAGDTASVIPGFSSGVRKENGLIELRYHQKIVYGGEDHSGPDTHILTLCPVGNSYQFISNLRIED